VARSRYVAHSGISRVDDGGQAEVRLSIPNNRGVGPHGGASGALQEVAGNPGGMEGRDEAVSAGVLRAFDKDSSV